MEIKIKDRIGVRCIIREDGQKIYDDIYTHLKNGDKVKLDFSGVSQFASPFFNFSIGQLLRDINVTDLRRLLRLENLEDAGDMVVKRVVENAAKYYGDKDYRKIVDDILEQQAKETD